MVEIPITSKKTGQTELLTQEAKKSKKQSNSIISSKTEEIIKKDLVENQAPLSLYDGLSNFILGKFPKNKFIEKIQESASEELTPEQLESIYSLVCKKDLDLKQVKILAECLVKFSCYNKEKYLWIAKLLEKIFIHYVKPNFQRDSILYSLTDERDLDVLSKEIKNSIDQLKRKSKEKKSDETALTEKNINYSALEDNLTFLACALFHYSEKIPAFAIISFLTNEVFNVDKEAKDDRFISINSLAFIFSDGKKGGFSYFINFLIKTFKNVESRLRSKESEIVSLSNQYEKVKEQIELQKEVITKLETQNQQLQTEIDTLVQDLKNQKELAQHNEIHFKDINSKTKGQFLRFLESDFSNMLIDIQKGLERTPPKIDVAKSYLEIIIKKIEDQVKCLK
jgi:predicted  nucleic acid-binding Zn-ribbon protein